MVKFTIIVIIVVLTIGAVVPVMVDALAENAAAAIEKKADEYMQAQADAGFFSGSVLISRQGKQLFAKGYGNANAEWQIPNTTTTKFRIASITKTFVKDASGRVTQLILHQQGRDTPALRK